MEGVDLGLYRRVVRVDRHMSCALVRLLGNPVLYLKTRRMDLVVEKLSGTLIELDWGLKLPLLAREDYRLCLAQLNLQSFVDRLRLVRGDDEIQLSLNDIDLLEEGLVLLRGH